MKYVLLAAMIFAIGGWAKGAVVNEYVVTETDQPTSFDPLDADQSQNMPVARMIYATPIEIDNADSISSTVLERFDYNKSSKTLTWVVRKGLKFTNGQDLTPADVAFAVARMTFTRPEFPVIERIDGTSEWLKTSLPLSTLPRGIKVDGQTVTIRLTKDVPHPFFRFCLELFSIIPKNCVDPKTNKITCEKIPGSGRYSISERTPETILFKRVSGSDVPELVLFRYVPAIELSKKLGSLSPNSVIAGNESMFTEDELRKFSDASALYFLPASRFAVLQINPMQEPFKDKTCRAVFAEEFRNSYLKITNEYAPAESSVFTKLLPGYLSRSDLEATRFARISATERKNCIARIKKFGVRWGFAEKERTSAFVRAMTATLEGMDIHEKPKLLANRKELADKFVAGDVLFLNASSGFWANDPAGDLQMLFTPNLHKPLNFITTDATLQRLIKELEQHQDDRSKYVAVNRYLHDQAMFNIYSHVRRFFFSKDKDRLKQIPQDVTNPAPWQVFK